MSARRSANDDDDTEPTGAFGGRGISPEPVVERAVVFGSHQGLIGVLSEPVDPTSPRRAVVVSNIGTHHRVGPYRLYVELARRLAQDGWHTLRFDLSGHGDSMPRPGALAEDDAAALDVQEAMDWLATRLGIERFVLIGLCSGVTNSHAVAVADPRVEGAVFIDGYSYPTAGFYLRAYTLRYVQPSRWFRYAQRRLDAMTGRRPATEGEDTGAVAPIFARVDLPRSQFRRDVARMTSRGVRLLFVFTGMTFHRYNGRSQLFEMLSSKQPRGNIDVEFQTGADHLFTALDQRHALFDRVAAWLSRFDLEPSPPVTEREARPAVAPSPQPLARS